MRQSPHAQRDLLTHLFQSLLRFLSHAPDKHEGWSKVGDRGTNVSRVRRVSPEQHSSRHPHLPSRLPIRVGFGPDRETQRRSGPPTPPPPPGRRLQEQGRCLLSDLSGPRSAHGAADERAGARAGRGLRAVWNHFQTERERGRKRERVRERESKRERERERES